MLSSIAAAPFQLPDTRGAQAYGKGPEPGSDARATGGQRQSPGAISDAEKAVVAELAQTDREVRAHERAHLAAAGGLARGGAIYSYQRGPDGQLYAVGGEVSIDVSAGRTPQETLERARQVRAAALAPANPSSQDRAVAAQASQLALQAQIDLAQHSPDQGFRAAVLGHDGPVAADVALAMYRANEAGSIDRPRHLVDIYV